MTLWPQNFALDSSAISFRGSWPSVANLSVDFLSWFYLYIVEVYYKGDLSGRRGEMNFPYLGQWLRLLSGVSHLGLSSGLGARGE